MLSTETSKRKIEVLKIHDCLRTIFLHVAIGETLAEKLNVTLE